MAVDDGARRANSRELTAPGGKGRTTTILTFRELLAPGYCPSGKSRCRWFSLCVPLDIIRRLP